MKRFALVALLMFGVVALLAVSAIRAVELHRSPPTFLSAVATYAPDGRFGKLVVGSTRFLTCREALDDTQGALAKAAELAPPGAKAIGLCIPVPTYNDLDLIQQ